MGQVQGSQMGNRRGQTAIIVLLNATSAWSLLEKLSSACAATCTAGLAFTRYTNLYSFPEFLGSIAAGWG
ncbi:hypothetical protein Chor_011616 [Crotalus horridus]